MTTEITVDTTAGWPVEVLIEGAGERSEIVPPGMISVFHLWDGTRLTMTEMSIKEETNDMTTDAPGGGA